MASCFKEIKKIPKGLFEQLLESCENGFFGGFYPMAQGTYRKDKIDILYKQSNKLMMDKNSFAFMNIEDNQHIRQLWIGKQIGNKYLSQMVLFNKDKNDSKAYLYTDTDWIVEFGNFLKENNIDVHQSKFIKYSAFEDWFKHQLTAGGLNYNDYITEEFGPEGQIIINYFKELRVPNEKTL
tara:strand:- start:35 stop:577 length:543 start_codon:yes stop_codon:yes gene_type:complete